MANEALDHQYIGIMTELGIMVVTASGVEVTVNLKPLQPPSPRLKTFLPRYTTCKAIVGKFLEENERTRGSDKLLIYLVDRYCSMMCIWRFSHETITRARRGYNKAGLYLPSTKTQSYRRNRERDYRDASKESLL